MDTITSLIICNLKAFQDTKLRPTLASSILAEEEEEEVEAGVYSTHSPETEESYEHSILITMSGPCLGNKLVKVLARVELALGTAAYILHYMLADHPASATELNPLHCRCHPRRIVGTPIQGYTHRVTRIAVVKGIVHLDWRGINMFCGKHAQPSPIVGIESCNEIGQRSGMPRPKHNTVLHQEKSAA